MLLHTNHYSVAAVLSLLLMIGGCGRKPVTVESNRSPISGKVTLDGKPLGGGSVTFVATEDARYRTTAAIGTGGDFSVADAPQGLLQATVETESLQFSKAPGYVKIPAKYSKPGTSGLTVKVERGQANVVTLELRSR